jgi:putative ABC transport system permease protein
MLQIEGCIYTVGTVLVAMIVGIPAGYAFFLYGKSNSWVGLNIYHFPLAVILIMVAVIAVMQFILSFVLSRNIRKESLVERIRYQE